MITKVLGDGSVHVLVMPDGTLVQQGTKVCTVDRGQSTYIAWRGMHVLEDKDGRRYLSADYQTDMRWREL